MMKGGYFLFNGQFHKEGEPVFTLADLSRRASGFVESFRAEHNEILFPDSISRHLIATAKAVGFDISNEIGPEGRLLRKDVSRLLNKNKLYLAARIEIQVYKSVDKTNFVLSAQEMERGYYPLKEPGLLLSFYDLRDAGIQESAYDLSPDSPFVLHTGKQLAEDLNMSDLIILDGEGHAFGSLYSSIAYIEKDQLYFPAESSYPNRCAIREEVSKSAKEVGLAPLEKEAVTRDLLLNADEVFLFDACKGIQKILGLEERRYFSSKTRSIAERLSQRAKM